MNLLAMKSKGIIYYALFLLAATGCQEENNDGITENAPFFYLQDDELRIGDNLKDTLRISTSHELQALERTIRLCSEEIPSEIPFTIDTLYKTGNNEYAIVFSDRGTMDVYNYPVTLQFSQTGTGTVASSDTFHIYKNFFTELPVVFINTPKEAEIVSKEDWLEGTELKIYDGKGNLNYNGIIEIKGRGNTTWSFPKKPYALKLEEKSEILGMPKHKRWVLLANYLDKTLMRNHIAFFLAQSEGISLEWTPRGKFVDVVLNGKHNGCYYLCEQIKIDENRIHIHENTPEDIDGGFLLEFDTNFDEANKFYSYVKKLPVMVKEPDEDDLTPDQFSFIQDYINNIDKILYASDFAETRQYEEFIDVQTFVDYYFIYELTGNSELNWPKSCYMYRDKGGKLKAGPVWDFDYATFGPFYDYFRQGASETGIWWFSRLHEVPAVQQLRAERWNILYPSFYKVLDEVERTRSLIHKSAEINSDLWPITGTDPNKEKTLSFDEAVDRLRNNLKEQIEWLNNNI